MSVGLGLVLVFVRVFRFSMLCVLYRVGHKTSTWSKLSCVSGTR